MAARVRDLLGAPPPRPPDEPAGRVGGNRSIGAWRRLSARLRALPVRADPGRRSALALGIAVLVAALVTGGWVILQRPRAVPVSANGPALPATATPVGSGAHSSGAPPSDAGPSDSSAVATASGSAVVVDVGGKVRHPGLYRLPAGSRVDDAVRAAGGSLPRVDLTSLNLAARVVDGQQILVGATPPAVPAGAGGTGGSTATAGAASSAPVDLNTASPDQLQALPGVGPVLAQHIVDWRTAHGTFTSVGQLDDVPGIGTVKFAALRSLVTV